MKDSVVFIPFGEMITIPTPADFFVLEPSNLRIHGRLSTSDIPNFTSFSGWISNEGGLARKLAKAYPLTDLCGK